jgi:UDPglucose--hexose-1-phosphate uridylyltransferase
MAKYVPDVSSRRWLIISASRSTRPGDNGNRHVIDPFAVGNESLTAEEVYRLGKGAAGEKGWLVRVVNNKFPITDKHEVVIHSPDPKKDINEMPLKQVEAIFTAYRDRFNIHKKEGQVLIFCNHGEHAGASLSHPHSQLVVIPPQINLDSLTREPLNNVVVEDKLFTAYCPDFSQWPYELWIVPKAEKTMYGDITDGEIPRLADLVKKMITRLYKIYEEGHYTVPFAYNYYISPRESWYLRIIPRFVHRAGFELGTGLSVNIVDPRDAAMSYKGIDPEVNKMLEKLKGKF